jgi:hypothetical protein
MTLIKTKLYITALWLVGVLTLFAFHTVASTSGRAPATYTTSALAGGPDIALVDRFDAAIQKRFLANPNFGMARVAPVRRTGARHIDEFYAETDEEQRAVAELEKAGWIAGLYLYGRTAMPMMKHDKPQEKFDIKYYLNAPLPITSHLKKSQLPGASKLLDRVKTAFVDFQTPEGPNANATDFSIGKWAYYARPVRAANESCILCHSDYVITARLGNGQFKVRKRVVGDANGVIVYGFSKKD